MSGKPVLLSGITRQFPAFCKGAHYLATALVAPVVILSAGCKTIRVQERQFFDPRPAVLPDSARAGEFWGNGYTVREGAFSADGGARLHRIFLDRQQADVAILYFGGANFQAGQDFLRVRPLARLGADIVMVDYPGYGGSTGTPSLAAFRRRVWPHMTRYSD